MVSFDYLSTVLMSGWRVTTIIMLLHHNIPHVHTSDFFCMKYNFSSCWHLTNSSPLKIDSFSKSALSKLCPCFPHKCPFGLSSMLFTGDLGLHVNAQESNIFSWTNFLFFCLLDRNTLEEVQQCLTRQKLSRWQKLQQGLLLKNIVCVWGLPQQ